MVPPPVKQPFGVYESREAAAPDWEVSSFCSIEVLTKTGHVPLWRVVSIRKTMENPTNLMVDDHVSTMFICFLFNVDHKFKIYRYTNIPYFQTSKYHIADSISRKCPRVSWNLPWEPQLCQVSPGRSDTSVDMVPRRSWLGRLFFHRGWCPGCGNPEFGHVWRPEMLAENVCL